MSNNLINKTKVTNIFFGRIIFYCNLKTRDDPHTGPFDFRNPYNVK